MPATRCTCLRKDDRLAVEGGRIQAPPLEVADPFCAAPTHAT